jgi:uncharacterized protein YdeI (YjbR/CyaY-like superfamily)
MDRTAARVEAFFAAQDRWRDTLGAVRALLLEAGLHEDFKWRSPVYTVEGANVAILWGFKEYAALGFFKGVLLRDDAGLLEAPGENSRSARLVRFTDTAQVAALRPVLIAYAHEAIALERAGRKVDFPKDDLPVPAELRDRLAADPALRDAFQALTPGRQRGYLLHFGQPKQAATRIARIERSAARILAGKGINDR